MSTTVLTLASSFFQLTRNGLQQNQTYRLQGSTCLVQDVEGTLAAFDDVVVNEEILQNEHPMSKGQEGTGPFSRS